MPHTSLSELAKRFLANEPSYVSSDYLESDARSEFIDPLLAHLGWDMENRSGLAPLLREVLREETLPTETKGPKRPDYTFRINGVRRLHAEAKRPGVDIVKDSYSAFQCRSYGWSAGHPVSVLTNFRTTSVYDTTIQPHAGDDPDVALIARVPVGHLVDRLNDLSKHVGREAIKQGYILASKTPIPVNSQFLAKIKSWRILLAQDLRNRHPQLPLNDCNDISQKLINRIIFIRMCEDRDIEQHDTLKNCNSEDSYGGLSR
jgi:hypothetical protein